MTQVIYPYQATFEFGLHHERTAGDLLRILTPERMQNEGERTKVDLVQREGTFILDIRSQDIKGLRAAMNSYLRWIECSIQVSELGK